MLKLEYNELIIKARALGEEEKWEEAIYYYEQALLTSENVLLYDFLDYALAYLEIGEKEKSLNLIYDVIDENPENYLGYHYLGLYYFTVLVTFLLRRVILSPS